MKTDHKYTHLPITAKEVKQRGWNYLDVILFSGDAYIDHPSFGIAVIGRVLENIGLKVAIIPQPNWQDDLRDFKKLGKPRLFFGVSAGNMDSMVNHYTANKRLRSNDAYTADGQKGFRPDYASIVYSNILKKIFPDVPVVIGGVEASLRRLTHYDYWSNKLKPSILVESRADLLVYGMAEKTIVEIAKNLIEGKKISELTQINQTAYIFNKESDKNSYQEDKIILNSHKECLKSKKKFAENFRYIEEESNKIHSKVLMQEVKGKIVVVNPPNAILNEKELDKIYDLPFSRLPHYKYQKKGAIPAFEMIKFSINIHRGCFGGCSFCTISAHQGKFIQSRSEKSILNEVKQVAKMPDFKGYISDLGGPSANMYKMAGIDLTICEKCKRPSCIFPSICYNLNTSHKALNNIYTKASKIEGIKKAFIGSGIRYDLLFDKKDEIRGDKLEYTKNLIKNHVSGRLKIAPEHTSDKVLKLMRKPSFKYFHKFKAIFERINKSANLNQQLIPYFISSHPESQITDMAELAAETKALNFKLEQVQDFTPTPMTLATVIYYSGYHPFTMEKIYTAKDKDAKLNQRIFFFWYKREFRKKIENKLNNIGRLDLLKKLMK